MITKTIINMLPLFIAALGGLFTELAGVLNIALEGLILTGAFTAVMVTEITGSFMMGFTAAIVSTTAVAYLFAFTSIRLKGNIFVTGLAINLLVPPLISMISKSFYGTRGVIRLNDSLHNQHALLSILFMVSLAAMVTVILRFTPLGLHIRTAGINKTFLESRAVQTAGIQTLVILFSGVACGIAGAVIALRLGVFIPGISAGRGWIALVAIYLGDKKPFPIMAACFLFALAEALSDAAQGFIEIPATIILSFPYFITILVLVLYSIFKKKE
jgi:simple sugar transport system permease protein